MKNPTSPPAASSTLKFAPRGSRFVGGVPSASLRTLEHRFEAAIRRGAAPGGVLLAARGGRILRLRAVGERDLTSGVAMTPDTLFDLASLTKVVATATATLGLVEDGRLRLDDRVADFLPDFAAEGKGAITLLDLLTHRSGLKAYESVAAVRLHARAASPPEAVIAHIAALPLQYPTGEFRVYSCLNYLALARVNEIAAGESQHAYLARRVWGPLGMHDTGYAPTPEQVVRLAPTRPPESEGVVEPRARIHDPLAAFHGATEERSPGNAGVFSTAHDLAIFCQMLLDEGTYGGVRVLQPESVRRMLEPTSALPLLTVSTSSPGEIEYRALGWMVHDRPPQGRVEDPLGTHLSHSGYTGTSLWLDRRSRAFLVLLTNAVLAGEPPTIHDCRLATTAAFLEGLYETR